MTEPTSDELLEENRIQVLIVTSKRSLDVTVRRLLRGLPIDTVLNGPVADESRKMQLRLYPERLAVLEREGQLRYLKVKEIDWIKAEKQYVRLHVGNKTFLARGKSMTIRALASRLDPARFLQVHRSHLVNLDSIEVLKKGGLGKKYAVLTCGREVPISQTHWERLQTALGDPKL